MQGESVPQGDRPARDAKQPEPSEQLESEQTPEPEPFTSADVLREVQAANAALGPHGLERVVQGITRAALQGSDVDIEYLAVESGVSDVEAFSKHVHAVWDAHADQLEAYLAREVPGVPVEVFASIVQKADPNRFAKLVEKHLRTQSPKVWAGEVAKFKTLTAKPAAVSQVREQTAEEAPRPRQLSEGETQAFLREAMERFKRDNIRPARRR